MDELIRSDCSVINLENSWTEIDNYINYLYQIYTLGKTEISMNHIIMYSLLICELVICYLFEY